MFLFSTYHPYKYQFNRIRYDNTTLNLLQNATLYFAYHLYFSLIELCERDIRLEYPGTLMVEDPQLISTEFTSIDFSYRGETIGLLSASSAVQKLLSF